ncbi:hypothetical protein V9T40_013106 [Parthenolecanium corni]|uniref:Uncharacterized protein n=1 Tax=Parthenolecanium corni TaxID=536013 RepID=A0AAN9TKQ8_9HEMI
MTTSTIAAAFVIQPDFQKYAEYTANRDTKIESGHRTPIRTVKFIENSRKTSPLAVQLRFFAAAFRTTAD